MTDWGHRPLEQVDADAAHWEPCPDDSTVRLVIAGQVYFECDLETAMRLRREQRAAEASVLWNTQVRPTEGGAS